MIINSLSIKDGFFEKRYEFDKGFNLIHSSPNSVGKTTLLRSLIYTMGYPIPGTKKFKMSTREFSLQLQQSNKESACIVRKNRGISFKNDFFSLPAEQYSLQKKIFEIENDVVLLNLLGTFYVDQEKGWTLLNRGKVIGNIRFNIHDFILAVSGKFDKDLSNKLDSLNRAVTKYKNFQNIVEYKNSVNEECDFAIESSVESVDKEKTFLEYKKKNLERELAVLKNSLKSQNYFIKFIDSLQLRVKLDDGTETVISKDNLSGVEENSAFIKARIELLADEISSCAQKLLQNERESKKIKSDLDLIHVESLERQYDRQICSLKIDQKAVSDALKDFEKQKKEVEEQIDDLVKTDQSIVDRLHAIIFSYAKELDLDENYVSASQDYIFTTDLKSLSGAIFHKIVFCFKMAYVKIVEERCNCILPIILDSPSGREVSEDNVRKMMEILRRDYNNHQIIVASIYNYGFADKVIEIKESMMENAEMMTVE